MQNSGFLNAAPIIFVRKHWLTVAFLLGFVTDYLLLNQVDNKVDAAILFFYVVLASVSLVLFYIGVAEKAPFFLVRFFNKFMPILMQYSFGGLLSGMLIFYGRSGDLMVSAPFLVLIIGIILLNELVKKRSDRLLYNLTVYFIGILSYFVLMVPVWIGQMGDFIFVGSGLLSLIIIIFLVKILSWIIPNFLILEKRLIVFSIGSLYVLFNSFYFLNIIPPIPLSITELNIYQDIESTDHSGYTFRLEKKEWWQKIPLMPISFNPIKGKGAYCFARVYAPTTLKTDIVHRWEYRDVNGDWQNHFTKTYSISGENKNGYRGYTMIENIHDGQWRCSVETVRGQVLGRRTFTVDTSKQPTSLVTVVE